MRRPYDLVRGASDEVTRSLSRSGVACLHLGVLLYVVYLLGAAVPRTAVALPCAMSTMHQYSIVRYVRRSPPVRSYGRSAVGVGEGQGSTMISLLFVEISPTSTHRQTPRPRKTYKKTACRLPLARVSSLLISSRPRAHDHTSTPQPPALISRGCSLLRHDLQKIAQEPCPTTTSVKRPPLRRLPLPVPLLVLQPHRAGASGSTAPSAPRRTTPRVADPAPRHVAVAVAVDAVVETMPLRLRLLRLLQQQLDRRQLRRRRPRHR
jgi:hypothetical protein